MTPTDAGIIHKFKPFGGPLRFTWIDPDTKRRFQAKDKSSLMNQIINYRAQNQLEPIQYLAEVLENYWCGLPENVGQCAPVKLNRDVLTTLRGGLILLYKVVTRQFVSQEMAEARADICVKCPKNIFPDRGPFLKWSDEEAYRMVGNRVVSKQQQLGNCAICTCVLKAKIHIKGPFPLTKEEHEQMIQVRCWVTEEQG